MKAAVKFLGFGLTVLAFVFSSCTKDGDIGPIGPQGPQGEQGPVGPQGPKGEDGNANVQSFELTVVKADWSSNEDLGANEYRIYDIPPENTGGINVSEFYNAGGVVLAYAKIVYDDAETRMITFEKETKQLPFVTTVNRRIIIEKGPGDFGLRIELSTDRGAFLMAKTDFGWDAVELPDFNVPDTVNFRIVFIAFSNSTSSKSDRSAILDDLKSAGVHLNDYEAVMDYFGLAY